MAPPADHGFFGIIIVREVIHRHMDGQAQILVPNILVAEGFRIILGMAGNENLSATLGLYRVNASLIGGRDNPQIPNLLDVLPQHRGVAGMGYHKGIVKAAEQNGSLVISVVGIDAEEFLRQWLFIDTIMVIKACLSAPANVQRGMDIGLAPLHDPAQFIPVVHFLKRHLLHRRAGNDHAVKLPVLQFIKGLVKGKQMFLGNIL